MESHRSNDRDIRLLWLGIRFEDCEQSAGEQDEGRRDQAKAVEPARSGRCGGDHKPGESILIAFNFDRILIEI